MLRVPRWEAGRQTILLRVPRPLCGLLLYLRRTACRPASQLHLCGFFCKAFFDLDGFYLGQPVGGFFELGEVDFFFQQHLALVADPGVAFDGAAHALGCELVGVGLAFHQNELAAATVFGVGLEHGVGGGGAAGKAVEDDGVWLAGQLQNALQQGHRFGRDGALLVFEHAHFQQGSLGVLGVTDFVVEPESLGGTALFDIREIALETRLIAAVVTPPNATLRVPFFELRFLHAPVSARRWPFNDTPVGAGNGIGAFAVIVAGRQVARSPRSTRIVVGVGEAVIHLHCALQQIGPPLLLVFGVDQHIVVVFAEELCGVLG